MKKYSPKKKVTNGQTDRQGKTKSEELTNRIRNRYYGTRIQFLFDSIRFGFDANSKFPQYAILNLAERCLLYDVYKIY